MLTKVHNLIRSSELRKNLSKYLKDAETDPVVITSNRGGGTRVILNAPLYNKLLESYMDYQDTEELKNLVANDEDSRKSWDDIQKNCE